MAKVKIGKPPKDLKDDQLHAWYEDQFEDAYEKTLFDHREKVRAAEAKVEQADEALAELRKTVPEEGDVLLKGDDAQRWNELKEIKVDELQAQAAEGQKIVRTRFLEKAAEAAGYKPQTFAELVELKGVKVVADEADGQTAYKVEVEKDGKAEKVDLTEHFQAAFADWLPALTPSGQTPPTAPPSTGTPPLGRLPNTPPRQRPSDAQRAVLEKAQAERAKSQNVVLQSLNPQPKS